MQSIENQQNTEWVRKNLGPLSIFRFRIGDFGFRRMC